MDQIADALEIDASRVKELIREMETSGHLVKFFIVKPWPLLYNRFIKA